MSIQAVIEQLEYLNHIHIELLQLAEQKKQTLVNNQVDELTVILNKETKLLKQVALHEQEREACTAAFLQEQGFRANGSVTTTELIKLVSKSVEKQALQRAQHDLMETIGKLKAINELNQTMIKQSLSFIDYSLDLLVGSQEDDAVYQHPQQQAGQAKRRGVFDTSG